uniref:Uncharacterized protein n=1 Tax=Arundo donax TaxID=35708 RepID=A0A0A8Z2S3_ARUDO
MCHCTTIVGFKL